jgi:hypothetical protein
VKRKKKEKKLKKKFMIRQLSSLRVHVDENNPMERRR